MTFVDNTIELCPWSRPLIVKAYSQNSWSCIWGRPGLFSVCSGTRTLLIDLVRTVRSHNQDAEVVRGPLSLHLLLCYIDYSKSPQDSATIEDQSSVPRPVN